MEYLTPAGVIMAALLGAAMTVAIWFFVSRGFRRAGFDPKSLSGALMIWGTSMVIALSLIAIYVAILLANAPPRIGR